MRKTKKKKIKTKNSLFEDSTRVFLPSRVGGVLWILKRNYRNIYEAVKEDVVNAIEEGSKYIRIDVNKNDDGHHIQIIGGITPLNTQKLMEWFTSTKRFKGFVGQRGEARWAAFAFGVKKKIYEQKGKKFTLSLTAQPTKLWDKISNPTPPEKTDYTSLETKLTYIIPSQKQLGYDDFEIDELRDELLLTFCYGLKFYGYIIDVNGKPLQWENVFPHFEPDEKKKSGIKRSIKHGANTLNLVAWKANSKSFKHNPFPKQVEGYEFLGVRASIKGILVNFDALGSTGGISDCFAVVDDPTGMTFYSRVDSTKKHMHYDRSMKEIIRKVREHINKSPIFNPPPISDEEANRYMWSLVCPHIHKRKLRQRICPKCESDKLTSYGRDGWQCRKCGYIFDKYYTWDRGTSSGKGFVSPEIPKIVKNHWENKPFLFPYDPLAKPPVWGLNTEPDDEKKSFFPKLTKQYDGVRLKQTEQRAAILRPLWQRMLLSKNFVTDNIKILQKEWLQLDDNLEKSLQKRR